MPKGVWSQEMCMLKIQASVVSIICALKDMLLCLLFCCLLFGCLLFGCLLFCCLFISFVYFSPVFSSSQIGCIPEHKASVHINTIEGHIDYMSAIILLVNGTGVKVRVWDSWEGINLDSSEHAAAKIQVCCSFDWSTCQISVHRATAKGMFGIIQRIYDFIVQQKKRSERMIGSMIPAGTTASTIFAAYQAEQKRAEKSRAAEIG